MGKGLGATYLCVQGEEVALVYSDRLGCWAVKHKAGEISRPC
jgi:hypothetical protein